MTRKSRNEYGAPTQEFREAMAPHEAAIRCAVADLLDQEWSHAEVYQALMESVSISMSSRRLQRAIKMHKEEKEAAMSNT